MQQMKVNYCIAGTIKINGYFNLHLVTSVLIYTNKSNTCSNFVNYVLTSQISVEYVINYKYKFMYTIMLITLE